MQRGNHILPFLTPLCGVFDEKKLIVLLQCYKNEKCVSHAPYEAQFFVLPMLRKNDIFEFDFTPTVKMTLFKGG